MANNPDSVQILPPGHGEESGPQSPTKWHRTRGRLTSRPVLITAGGVLVIALLGGGYAVASTGNTNRYRLATVTNNSVDQGMALTGTLSPISQAGVSFPVSGTVADVYVQAGEYVNAGDQLAKLDTTDLKAAVTSAKSTLAQAELSLEQAENGQSSGGSSSGGSSSGGSASAQSISTASSTSKSSQPSGKPSGSAGGSSSKQLKAQQQAVIKAQQQVSQGLQAAQVDLKAATAACTAADSTALDTDSSASPSSSPTSSSSDDANACIAAQQKVLASQQNVAQLQTALSQAQSQLNQTLQQTLAAVSSQSGSGSGSGGSSGNNSGGSSTTTVTAEDLAAAEAKVDAAEAALRAAQQNLAAATIVSPIDGKVAEVGFAEGDSVSADSTTQVVTVTGSSQYQVTVQVPVAKISQVHRGDTATVKPDGATDSVDAAVVSIGVSLTTTNSAVTYPVTLSIKGKSTDLRIGASASVDLVTEKASAVLVVPTSAVRHLGTNSVVMVLNESGGITPTPVATGAIGGIYTEIKSGLTEGQQIVLADLDEEVPTSNTQNTFRGGFGGGFGGGGFGGGGGARTFTAGSR